MEYVITPAPVVGLPVSGTAERFPVRRVYCVGRNYADHALEMGIDPRTDPPFYFLKPSDGVVATEGGVAVSVPYPSLTSNFHYEVELVVAIGRGGQDIAAADALSHIYGHAVGIDLTRRDLQQAKRKAGQSWEIGKTFDRCAPIGAIHPLTQTGSLGDAAIALGVDGATKQSSRLGRLIWSVPELIADLSRYFPLHAGDLIFTGTPEGVGPLQVGQRVVAHIDGLSDLIVEITAPVHGAGAGA